MQPSKAGIASLIAQLEKIDVPLAGGSGNPPLPPLNNQGGGGTPNGMEPRIARLEAHMENVQRELVKLSDLPANLATLTERVAHLPTKEYMVRIAIGSLTVVALLITFSEKLHLLVK